MKQNWVCLLYMCVCFLAFLICVYSTWGLKTKEAVESGECPQLAWPLSLRFVVKKAILLHFECQAPKHGEKPPFFCGVGRGGTCLVSRERSPTKTKMDLIERSKRLCKYWYLLTKSRRLGQQKRLQENQLIFEVGFCPCWFSPYHWHPLTIQGFELAIAPCRVWLDFQKKQSVTGRLVCRGLTWKPNWQLETPDSVSMYDAAICILRKAWLAQSRSWSLDCKRWNGFKWPSIFPTPNHWASTNVSPSKGATYTTETLEWSRWLKMGLSAAKLGKSVLSAATWLREMVRLSCCNRWCRNYELAIVLCILCI